MSRFLSMHLFFVSYLSALFWLRLRAKVHDHVYLLGLKEPTPNRDRCFASEVREYKTHSL